jgi:hypothetical protein
MPYEVDFPAELLFTLLNANFVIRFILPLQKRPIPVPLLRAYCGGTLSNWKIS